MCKFCKLQFFPLSEWTPVIENKVTRFTPSPPLAPALFVAASPSKINNELLDEQSNLQASSHLNYLPITHTPPTYLPTNYPPTNYPPTTYPSTTYPPYTGEYHHFTIYAPTPPPEPQTTSLQPTDNRYRIVQYFPESPLPIRTSQPRGTTSTTISPFGEPLLVDTENGRVEEFATEEVTLVPSTTSYIPTPEYEQPTSRSKSGWKEESNQSAELVNPTTVGFLFLRNLYKKQHFGKNIR